MFIDPKFYNVSTNNWYAVVVFFFAATPNEPNSVNFMLLVLYQTTEKTEKKNNLNKFIVHMWFFTHHPKNYSSFHFSFRNFTILLFYISSLSPAHAHSVDCIVYARCVLCQMVCKVCFYLSPWHFFSIYMQPTKQANRHKIQWGGGVL